MPPFTSALSPYCSAANQPGWAMVHLSNQSRHSSYQADISKQSSLDKVSRGGQRSYAGRLHRPCCFPCCGNILVFFTGNSYQLTQGMRYSTSTVFMKLKGL